MHTHTHIYIYVYMYIYIYGGLCLEGSASCSYLMVISSRFHGGALSQLAMWKSPTDQPVGCTTTTLNVTAATSKECISWRVPIKQKNMTSRERCHPILPPVHTLQSPLLAPSLPPGRIQMPQDFAAMLRRRVSPPANAAVADA